MSYTAKNSAKVSRSLLNGKICERHSFTKRQSRILKDVKLGDITH